jgi:hypothetical protein
MELIIFNIYRPSEGYGSNFGKVGLTIRNICALQNVIIKENMN